MFVLFCFVLFCQGLKRFVKVGQGLAVNYYINIYSTGALFIY